MAHSRQIRARRAFQLQMWARCTIITRCNCFDKRASICALALQQQVVFKVHFGICYWLLHPFSCTVLCRLLLGNLYNVHVGLNKHGHARSRTAITMCLSFFFSIICQSCFPQLEEALSLALPCCHCFSAWPSYAWRAAQAARLLLLLLVLAFYRIPSWTARSYKAQQSFPVNSSPPGTPLVVRPSDVVVVGPQQQSVRTLWRL